MKLFPGVKATIDQLLLVSIADDRKEMLDVLVRYVQKKIAAQQDVHLHLICTHNSRRSQFAQIWAQVAAFYYGIPVHAYSGGVEVTAFNPRAVEATERAGFKVVSDGNKTNPHYQVTYSESQEPMLVYSKLVEDAIDAAYPFAAVMTCSHADENCPYVPGTEQQIAIRYEDPKAYDDTAQETQQYDACFNQIGSEMLYVFSRVRNK